MKENISDSGSIKIKAAKHKKLRQITGYWKHIIGFIGFVMASFHIYFVGFRPVTPWILLPAHIGFGCVLILLLYPASNKSPKDKPTIIDIFLVFLAILSCMYFIIESERIIYRIGVMPTNLDVIFSSILLLLVLEVTRRTSGKILPLVALIFIVYGIIGGFIPLDFLRHRGYSFPRLITYLAGMNGLLSTPIAVSATFIFLLVLFANFIRASGAGQFFIDFAIGLTGGTRGGPAKTSVIASALFGTMVGSTSANVVSTGVITIPLMRYVGYIPKFAAAVEVVASTGGQIMPPVMGSAAFIMAQLIGVPYMKIMLAALIPAILYFTSVFLMLDLEAVKKDLKGLPREKLPNVKRILLQRGYLLTPIIVLIFVLVVMRASPIRAALWGIVTTIVLAFFSKETRFSLIKLYETLSKGAQASLGIMSACATAGLVIGILNLTGLGLKIAGTVMAVSHGILPVALLLAMLCAILFGMGLPTTAAYIICASVIIRVLLQLGLDPLTAHMFIFYFSCLSAITPPVAIAAYVASGLVNENPLDVAFTACKLGVAAFIVPYMFVYGPSLLFKGTIIKIFTSLVTAFIGIFSLAMAMQGWSWSTKISILQRILLMVSAITLIKPGIQTDLIGITVFIISLMVVPFINKKILKKYNM